MNLSEGVGTVEVDDDEEEGVPASEMEAVFDGLQGYGGGVTCGLEDLFDGGEDVVEREGLHDG